MKRMIVPTIGLFALILFSCKAKHGATATAQNTDYIISMHGIDSLKIDMTKAELEKLLKTQLTLPHVSTDSGPDTINVKYKSMDMILIMDGSSDSTASLRGIQTTNASCKTLAGLGVGSDKLKVIESYPDNKKYVALEYEEYPVRSTTRSVVAVMDTMGLGAIQFHIINKKVVSVELSSYYEFY